VLQILIHPQRENPDDGPLKWVAGLYYSRLNGKYEPFETFSRRFKSGGFNSAAWAGPAGKFTVRAFIDDLLNEAARGYVVISNKPAGTYLPPRTYGGSISVRF
jgi:hypothetical protein